MQTVESRIWKRVDKSGECWLWLGGKAGHGYGVMGIGSRLDGTRRQAYVHRLVYELTNGPLMPGYDVCHRCDTPACVRPDHLFAGTRTDNMHDAKAKGRLATGDAVAHRGESNVMARLTAAQVREIRALKPQGARPRNAHGVFVRGTGVTAQALALRYGVSDSLITAIWRGEAWRT